MRFLRGPQNGNTCKPGKVVGSLHFKYQHQLPALPQLIIPKLSRPDIPLKHDVQFLIGAILRLGHPKVAPNETQGGEPTEKEAQFAPEVGLVRVDHVGDGDGHDDTEKGLDGGGEGDGLAADAGGGDLAQDDEADGADGQVVHEIPHQQQARLRPDQGGPV